MDTAETRSKKLLDSDISTFDDTEVTQSTKKSPNRTRVILISIVLIVLIGSITTTVVFLLRNKSIEPDLSNDESTNISFMYINDIHLDIKYDEYSVASEKTSCREKSPTSTVRKPFGQYGCDTPAATFHSLMDYAPTVAPDISFLIFGGDSVGHALGLSTEGLRDVIKQEFDKFEEKFPNIPKFITLGNNDYTKNYGNYSYDQKDFESIIEVYGKYMTDSEKETFKKGGYYYRDFPTKLLRLVFMNTVIYSTNRPENYTDPYDQFAWVESLCEDAKTKGLKVALAMHIPPGVSYYDNSQGWKQMYIERLYQLLTKYDIEFSLAAHTHVDLFMPLLSVEHAHVLNISRNKVLKATLSDEQLALLDYTLSSPSVSPAHKNNPGFRIYYVNEGSIQNYDQYYGDIMLNPQDELKWQKEYSYNDVYGKNITMKEINKAIDWIRNTGEGAWRYREFTYTRAEDHLSFFYCILKAVTKAETEQCLNGVNTHSIHPYGGDIN